MAEIEGNGSKNEIKKKQVAIKEEKSQLKKLQKGLDKASKELSLTKEFYGKIENEWRDLSKVFSDVEVHIEFAKMEIVRVVEIIFNMDRIKSINKITR